MPSSEAPADIGQAATAVADAYASLRPLYLSLLEDLGVSDWFVLDRDLLLLQLFSDPRLDPTQLETLQIVYLIDKFVKELQCCENARFKVVFFKCHEALWQKGDGQAGRQASANSKPANERGGVVCSGRPHVWRRNLANYSWRASLCSTAG
ncbi:hypothetical protein WJX72_007797 [[Myrmecia] bisecta]|uniref:ATP-dependent RNA helicase DDX60 PIN-like domain-containing protein n=1 Tax=[Myrmecia] bisecta TaxID=41462 RepID=A0AAW1P6W6_9CHLO